jgi:two-component system, NarL family, sensor histidine kinase DesK
VAEPPAITLHLVTQTLIEALEAATNVARHSQARSCTVRLSVNGVLRLDVTDDGIGLDPNAADWGGDNVYARASS